MNNDGYRVLAIDMDSQGNLTELLSGQSSNEFIGKSVPEFDLRTDIHQELKLQSVIQDKNIYIEEALIKLFKTKITQLTL